MDEIKKDYLSIGFWLRETYRISLTNFSTTISALVLFIFPSAILLGVTAWYAFENVEIIWDPESILISSSGFEFSIYFIFFLLSVFASFISLQVLTVLTLKVIERRKNDKEDEENTLVPDNFIFDSVKDSPKYGLLGLISILLFYICFFSPSLVSGLPFPEPVLALIGLFQIVILIVGLYLLVAMIFWPIELYKNNDSFFSPIIKSIKLTNKFYFKVLGRTLILIFICYMTIAAFSTLGEIILGIFGLNPETTQEVLLSESWGVSTLVWIGETPAIAALRMVFNFLGISIAAQLWITGMNFLNLSLKEKLTLRDVT